MENHPSPFENYEENLENKIESELKTLIDIFKIKEEINLKEIIEGIILIYKRQFFLNIAVAVNTIIENLKVSKTNFSVYIKDIIRKLQEKNGIDTIRKCRNTLIELNILDEKENYYFFFEILFLFGKYPNSINFLFETPIQECRNLIEVLLDKDDALISVNDLLNMEKCIEFCLNIARYEDLKKIEDIEIMHRLKVNVSENEGILSNIKNYINCYINCYNEIRMLQASLDKSNILKDIVKGLLNNIRKESRCIFF